jgi:hypothetical protein
MKNDKCSKKFPKPFQNETIIDELGFTIYRRRDDDRYVMKNGVRLDNKSDVPYNMWQLKKYNAHINVEWCDKINMIKYLFKYINKGSDRVKVYFEITAWTSNASPRPELPPPNEIQEYIDVRYLSVCEAIWHFLEFDIHYRTSSIEWLHVHLPSMNYVWYEAGATLTKVLESSTAKHTMLIAWFDVNSEHNDCRHLSYCDFPKE